MISTASPLLWLGHSGGSFVTSVSPAFSSMLKLKASEVLIQSWTAFSLLIELLALAVVSDWLPLETASSNSNSCRVYVDCAYNTETISMIILLSRYSLISIGKFSYTTGAYCKVVVIDTFCTIIFAI